MKEIPLTNGGVTLVDDEDYEFLSSMSWHRSTYKGMSYAMRCFWVRGENRRVTYGMHRFLLIGHDGDHIDHIDRDGLNNQKSNLRVATYSQNQFNAGIRKDNSTGYRGVIYCKRSKRYHAQIQANKRHKFIGSFQTPKEAACAYDKAALQLHGKFARTNFDKESHQ